MAFIGTYRTRSGRFYFRWSFEQQPNGEVRAYILDAPAYGSMPSDGHSTHRYSDGTYCYVCYEPMPRNYDDAVVIAKEWAERTEDYIVYSEEF